MEAYEAINCIAIRSPILFMSVVQVVCSWVQIVSYVSWNTSYSFYLLFLKMVLMLPKWYTLVCNTLLFDQVYAIQLVTSISVRVQSAWPDHSISWKLVSVYNLCKFWMQGVVYWQPPESAMNKIEKIIREPAVSRYGSDDGIPELREALLEKVNSFHHGIYSMFPPISLTALQLTFKTQNPGF